MSAERFVLLGVARARSLWFRSVAQWATSAEFAKCVSTEELRAHLGSGRTFSAALLDAGLPSVDRDVIAAARENRCAVLVVDDGHAGRDWHALGATAVLPSTFTREQLLEVLAAHAVMIGTAERHGASRGPTGDDDPHPARVVTVCGPGGTGASTLAIALAQEVAQEGSAVLADLALRAEQAVLHDARDIAPGVQELVEAHRGRRPTADEVLAQTFAVAERGYRLLLGLRQSRYWSALRPRAFEAAFDTLTATFDTVVCDVTADFEGEDSGGSIDVEERNLMSRTAVLRADAVVVVGSPGVKGIHALLRVVGDVVDLGVAPARVVPVVNQAPRSPRARAEMTAAVAELAAVNGPGISPPVFLPRRRVEAALRDGVPIPAPLGALTAGAVRAVLAQASRRPTIEREPQPIVPGSLGSWTPEA
jgi:MinD-like ATPase involved in chromosome partitioning or flagellar assembly